MSEQSTVRVTMANMLLQLTSVLGCIAVVAAGGSSHTSVSNPHGGSYAYGVDHDSYGAWYGTSHPSLYGGLAVGHGSLGLGHGSLYDHGQALPQGDYGYATYGAGYGHGDYATSYQNVNMKSFGGEKVLHAGHSVHHGHGASSYSKIVQKFGHSGLYDGLDSYAGGYGHSHYAGHGVSQQNFNLKSYVHPPIHVDPVSYVSHSPLHEAISYAPHHEAISYTPHASYGHTLEDLSSVYGVYGQGQDSLNDFYGLGDYHNAFDYGHHGIPYSYPLHSSALGTYGSLGHYGYSDGLGYYH